MIETQNPEFLDLLLRAPQSQIDPKILALPHLHGNTIGFPRVLIEDMSCLHTQVFFDCCGLSFRQSRIPYFDDYRRILLVTTPNWRCHYWLSGRDLPEEPLLYISPWTFHLTEAQWQQIAPGFSGPHCQVIADPVEGQGQCYTREAAEFHYNGSPEHGIYCTVYRSISTIEYFHPKTPQIKTDDFIVLESNLVQIESNGHCKGFVRSAPPLEFLDIFGIDPASVYQMDKIAGCFGPWIFDHECNVLRDQYHDLKQQVQEEINQLLERASKGGRVSV
ncbi:MAG TPA: hypothetical protein PLL06_00250 [Acidobacteriota bacterium]|nr:hypothetical protein [Acidobacteriota bacterium]HNG91307.1 hypothetical protein [Acidobacteriota bacterium]